MIKSATARQFELIEYMRLHLISLEQDLEKIDYVNEHHFYRVKEAEIETTRHLLSVAYDIFGIHPSDYYKENE